MFEESVSSSPTFWSSLTSWFTPTIFFLILQLVIATIYIISSLSNNNNNNNSNNATHKHHQHQHHYQHEQQDPHETNHFQFQQQQQQPLARSPSLLDKLKSINFYSYYPHHTHETQQPQQYHQHHQHEQDHHETSHFRQQQQPLARSPSLLDRLKSINFYSYDPHTSQHHTHETQQPQQQQQQPQLPRSPSSVLQRLKSINLHTYFPTEPFSSYFTHEKTLEQPQKKTHVREKTPLVEETQQQYKQEEEDKEEESDDDVVGEISKNNNLEAHHDEGSCASMDEVFSKLQEGQGGNFTRSQSDTKPASGEVPVRLPRRMKKSASTKSAFSHFEEGDIVESRRPATVREGGAAADDGEDGGVDAKADDFINRFKQQLKLQRLDSIMRYKEMIGRGSGK